METPTPPPSISLVSITPPTNTRTSNNRIVQTPQHQPPMKLHQHRALFLTARDQLHKSDLLRQSPRMAQTAMRLCCHPIGVPPQTQKGDCTTTTSSQRKHRGSYPPSTAHRQPTMTLSPANVTSTRWRSWIRTMVLRQRNPSQRAGAVLKMMMALNTFSTPRQAKQLGIAQQVQKSYGASFNHPAPPSLQMDLSTLVQYCLRQARCKESCHQQYPGQHPRGNLRLTTTCFRVSYWG